MTGLALGAATGAGLPERLVRATFFASALGYLSVSVVDFAEHFRLEKEATGSWFSFVAIPVGESLNHAATTIVLVLLLALARPLRPPPLPVRDWLVLAAPLAFFALGWRDELVYHRRRAAHREDIMHTVAHLAGGVMIASLLAMRLVDWPTAAAAS